MKKFLIPGCLIAHAICNLVYWIDPDKIHWLSFAWATYFHCIQAFFLFTICLIFIYIRKKNLFDNQFLIIEAVYNLILCLTFELNYKGYFAHTYGLIITSAAIVFCTVLILKVGIQYDYFKDS